MPKEDQLTFMLLGGWFLTVIMFIFAIFSREFKDLALYTGGIMSLITLLFTVWLDNS